MLTCRWVAILIGVAWVGCREPAGSERRAGPMERTPQATATAPTSAEAEPAKVVVRIPGPTQREWLVIESPEDPAREAFAEARLVEPDHLVVTTRNVQRLRLELDRLRERAPGRMILHIDEQGIEITGTGGWRIPLVRSRVGAWQVAK